ncbi:MAG TPA: phosphotransferase [Acidimicrobiales bacterium]|nr:phosphotransferase [Acidimicrobiales bacterium]
MGTPALSMLWEADDPAEQLTRRFGFAGADAVAAWVAEVLERDWELDVTGCERVVISSWNVMAWLHVGERRLIAKWSALPHRFPRLRDAAQVVRWLDGHGIPVATPIPAVDGRVLVELANGRNGRLRSRLPLPGGRFLFGVLPVLDGDLLDVGDLSQVADAGRMLSAVHEALASCPHPVGNKGPAGQEQLIHNDFRSANVLHDGTRITAVLDLEEVTYGTRVADLARAAVLLGTRYRAWRPAGEAVREAFVAAYDDCAEIPLTAADREEFDRLVAENLKQKWWASPI